MGIRKLKSRLSKRLRMVHVGNEVHVTLCETVAEIQPPTHLPEHSIDNKLRHRARAGKVRLGARNRPEAYPGTSVQLPDEIVRTLLSESRGEY